MLDGVEGREDGMLKVWESERMVEIGSVVGEGASVMGGQFLSDCGSCAGKTKEECGGVTRLLVKMDLWPDEELMPRVYAIVGHVYVDKVVEVECKDMYPF